MQRLLSCTRQTFETKKKDETQNTRRITGINKDRVGCIVTNVRKQKQKARNTDDSRIMGSSIAKMHTSATVGNKRP